MQAWNTIDELRNIFISKYTESKLGSELEKACSEEYELARDYNGRQILELLQNVDDAYVRQSENNHDDVLVRISFKNNILEVGNTGTCFTADTLERLCLGRASDKSEKNIGNKGTGFRSLLNDAEWIEIHSAMFSVRFSEEYTKNVFAKYSNIELIERQKANWKKDYDFRFPIMNCPEQIEKRNSEFTTLIRIKIKESNSNKSTSIARQLEQPFYKSLLFLPNITKIIVENGNIIKSYFKENTADNEIRILEIGEHTNQEEFYLYDKVAMVGKKEANLIIAVPKNLQYDFTLEKLYCYFPIRNCITPIHALIHAPFITNNSRDDVPFDNEEINKKIFSEILVFIKEVAEKLVSHKAFELAVNMATPIAKSKIWEKESFNLRDEYVSILTETRFLPTVNEEVISIKDEPKLLKAQYIPEEFMGEEFKSLIVHLNQTSTDFIQELATFIKYEQLEYTAEELAESITQIREKLSLQKLIKLYLWWHKSFHLTNHYVPAILKNTYGHWIDSNAKIYLPTDTGISVLPDSLNWVSLCILDQNYVSEFISQLKDTEEWEACEKEYSNPGDKRVLAAYSEKNHFVNKFIEQSSSELIISSINQQIDTADKAKSFITWFFENYKDKMQEGSELSKLSFNLPNRNLKIYPVQELYFGKEYGNQLAEKLFRNTSYSALAAVKDLYDGKAIEEFKNFIMKLKVMRFPKIEMESVWSDHEFRTFIKQKYNYPITINYLKTMSINNFKELLRSLSTAEIIDWLSSDNDLRNLLFSQERESTANQQSNWTPTYFYSNEYIKYILNTTPWIEISEKKYPPCKIIKYEKLKDRIDGYYGISEAELSKCLGKDIAVYFQLDFKESLASLPGSDIKHILLQLPNFDKGEISRKLYLDILKLKKEESPSYNTSDIKVLAKDGRFYPNSEVKYADKRIAEGNKPKLLDVPTKQNFETIRKWLGVERYKSNLKLKSKTSIEQRKDFDKELESIKVAVLATIEQHKSNVDNLKRCTILPCSEIIAIDTEQNNKEICLSDYCFVSEGLEHYLKLQKDFEIARLRQTDEFSAAVIEIFRQNLNLELDSNLIELLISKDEKSKELKITDSFGADAWKDSYNLLCGKDINELVRAFFRKNNLDSALLKQLSEIDFTLELNENEFDILSAALKSISKDIQDLNALEQVSIDITNNVINKLRKLKEQKLEQYKQALYKSYKTETRELKYGFIDKLEFYKNFDFRDEIRNSICIDLETFLQTKFPELKAKLSESIDIDAVYTENIRSITNKINISETDFDYFSQNHKDIISILYFEIPDELPNQISEFVKSKEKDEQDDKLNVLDISNETKTVIVYLDKAEDSLCQSQNKGITEKSQQDYKKRATDNEKAGKAAEKIAYAELKKEFPELIWHSKYSINPADRNNPPPGGIICDMWNRNPEGKNTYFEVKPSCNEFEMSIHEYESMRLNSDNYEVILANGTTKEISRHKFSELDCLKKVNSYIFRFKQIRE